MQKTKLLYLDDTYQSHSKAKVMDQGEDEKGKFFILDQTIFYPQGGGQPTDQGWAADSSDRLFKVIQVRMENEIVKHYYTSENEIIRDSFSCTIDKEKRLLNAKYHTAGHLVAQIAEKFGKGKALKGHHFPGEAYVELTNMEEVFDLQNEVEKELEKNGTVTQKRVSFEELKIICPDFFDRIPKDKPCRIVQIEGFSFVPCGGTHVSSLKEIEHIQISKVKRKGKLTKISYQVFSE